MSLEVALQNKLSAGLAEMDLSLDAEKQAKLTMYVLLIDKWNKVHNLTAIRDPLEMVTLHILDSLSVLKHVQQCAPKRLLDVGAGAGLPSIVLAICMPELQVTAIDAVQKKASFMRQAKGVLALTNFSVESGRVESLNQAGAYDVIISRAFSEIALFVKLTQHLLAESGTWLAMKGVVPNQELQAAGITPLEIVPLHVAGLEADRHLVVFQKPHI